MSGAASGAELLAQVRAQCQHDLDQIERLTAGMKDEVANKYVRELRVLVAALDGCVLLIAEEAEKVRGALYQGVTTWEKQKALALFGGKQ